MSATNYTPKPGTCPLCGKPNSCANLKTETDDQACWCRAPSISIPEELLKQIPKEQQGVACICIDCVRAFHSL